MLGLRILVLPPFNRRLSGLPALRTDTDFPRLACSYSAVPTCTADAYVSSLKGYVL
jgi:hypothetical protein